MTSRKTISKRGTPLAMLAVLLSMWVCARVFTWESSLAHTAMAKSPVPNASLTQSDGAVGAATAASRASAPQSIAYPQFGPYLPYPAGGYYAYPPAYMPSPAQLAWLAGEGPKARGLNHAATYPSRGAAFPLAPRLIEERYPSGQRPALLDWRLTGGRGGNAALIAGEGQNRDASQAAPAPFPAQLSSANQARSGQASDDRWMLDAFGFLRQGSSAATIPQGRRPVYGASQLAAILQWRARPSSSHDPRVYTRAYHALVTGGETEIAAGVSARPIGTVPVRLYGELRATRNPALSDGAIKAETNLRPAAYAATEIAPQSLPLGLSLEAYGAGGYVGGNADTYFIDGQAAVTRKLLELGKSGSNSATVSLGAGVWGGAQKDARRVDIGPTLRFDVDIGNLPARVSVDYREQVAGDAEPDSGVAATVSTRF